MIDKGKSRNLSQINEILDNKPLEQFIEEQLLAKENINVLEIGTGYGRCLLELAWKFNHRNVNFNGITLKAKAPLQEREDLRTIAKEFDVIPADELANFILPEIFFYDATQLHFPDESIDFIYSAVTVRFIARKAEFLEEVARVLKPGGHALLDISESNWDYPYSKAIDDRILTKYTNRFVLKYGDELIPLPVYVKLFENDSFRFEFSKTKKCILHLAKLKASKLALQLDYDPILSVNGVDLPLINIEGKIRSGVRSVYNIHRQQYAALFEKGLLKKDDLP